MTDEEKEEYGVWSDDPVDRLESFMKEKDTFYGSIPELLAFCEIMYVHHQARICFRIFKHVQKEKNLRCDAIVPQLDDSEQIILIDLKSLGKADTVDAHYKLCESSSLCRSN